MEKIAICITTRNRYGIMRKSYTEWKTKLPDNSRIFIVDDASINKPDDLHPDFRFEENVGIAVAKNKCLELVKDYDHIFLVDDDVYPKVRGWEKSYIESGINHLSLTFEKNSKGIYHSPRIRKESEYNGLISYTAPNGCFLYIRKICLEVAGGMRTDFKKWGFEHYEYSQRIYAMGLTPKPFLDVPNSLDLIEVLDYHSSVKSSVDAKEKPELIRNNKNVLDKYFGSKEFVPFM